MRVRCPHCDGRLKAPDNVLGQKGRCPRCKGVVPMVPYEESEDSAVELAGASAIRGAPASRSEGSAAQFDTYGEAPLHVAPPVDDQGYGLMEDDQAASDAAHQVTAPPPIVGPKRLGTFDPPPKKSIEEREAELEDLRAGGRRYLWQTRLTLIGLGVLMIGINYYFLTTIDGMIQEFRTAVANSGRTFDPAKVEEIATGLRRLLLIECWLYLGMGVALCLLSIWISWAPKWATYAAFGIYVGVWVLDLLLIQALFGDIALGQSIFSLQTIMKFSIASGLWYGTRVGTEYDEQVVRPMRELRKEKLAEALE